ncbi:hypothetical protein [Mesorhizobium sp.]|uniref:hypothetical protein n=1 Tax=Mesorhizobium sp. TaxID=1871066 RepID=UPI000FE7694F|nr:hypothetical protein [Mesorhizobium sp.]RWC25886.1 MAG: hypothetical protein EOS27_26915 [Mesorhizobium sp.]TIX23886.1 MAG: hypothetical protein E5V35_20570 [Mesorhizobium sp.]
MTGSWKAEQDRQSQELAEIINREIIAFGERLAAEGRQPLLNSVAGALVSATGSMLASVKDRRIRKELRRVMDRGLPQAIAAHEGKTGSSEIVFAGRRMDG